MKPELKERFARLGPVQAIDRVRSGSPADIVIRPAGALGKVRTIDAIHALVRRNVAARVAMQAIDDMVAKGDALVEVPTVENGPAFADDLRSAGVKATRIIRRDAVDVRTLRDRLGLSVAAFAKRYRLSPRTVEGWEQGRSVDPIANNYLEAIAANPEGVARSMEEAID